MPITLSCTQCGAAFKVPDQYAGKKTNCRKCNALISIPSSPDGEPEIGFADGPAASPPSSISAIGRGSAGSLPAGADADDPPDLGSLSGDELEGTSMGSAPGSRRGGKLLSALPMVGRSDDAEAFDFAGPDPSAYHVRTRRPSRATHDNFTVLLIGAAVVAAIGAVVRTYVSWPPADKVKRLADSQLAPELLGDLGTPHVWIVLPHLLALISVFVLLAPTVMLAWFAGVKATNGTLPGDAYKRALGIACLPFIAASLVALTPMGGDFKVLMLAQLLTVPIAWLLMDRIHGARGAEGAIVIGAATVGVALVVAGVNMGMGLVTDGSRQAYETKFEQVVQTNLQKREQEARAKREAEELATRQREQEAAEAVRKKAAEEALAKQAATPDAGQTAIAAFQQSVNTLAASIEGGALNREAATEALAATRTTLAAHRTQFGDRAEWAAIETRLTALDPMVANLPSAKPDDSIYAALDAPAQWSMTALNVEPEVSLGPVNFRIPPGGRLLPNVGSPNVLDFDVPAVRSAKLHVEVVPVAEARQTRPWLVTSPTQTQPNVFSIQTAPSPAVSVGKFRDVTFTKISDAPAASAGEGRRVTFAGRLEGTWIVFRITTPMQTEDGLEPIISSVASCRVRRAGEVAVDPYGARLLVAELAKGVTPELIEALTKKKSDAETEMLKILDNDNGDTALMLYSSVLPVVASERSVRHLWRMAEPGRPNVNEARQALGTLDPKNAEPLRFALLDLGGDAAARKAAIKQLAKMEIDPKRRQEVTKVLISAVAMPSFISDTKGDELDNVLFRWGNDYVYTHLQKTLADEFAHPDARATAIGTLSRTGQAKYASSISRWILKEPETVVAALRRMGAAGETEAVRLLGEKSADARKYGAVILEEVGTNKSLSALQRAAKDSRDSTAAAAAQTAYEIVKARVDSGKPAAAPATMP